MRRLKFSMMIRDPDGMLRRTQSYATACVDGRLMLRTNPIEVSAGGRMAAIVRPAMSKVRGMRGISKRRSTLTPEMTAIAARMQANGTIGRM